MTTAGQARAVASSLPGFPGGPAAQELGVLSYRANPDGSVNEDPAWVKANIVTEDVPIIGPVTCNRVMFPELIGALRGLEAQGLGALINAGEAASQQRNDCWAPTFIGNDPTKGLSYHAWGIAIDLNRNENPVGGTSHQDPRLVAIMQSAGFQWGGTQTPSAPAEFDLTGFLFPQSQPVVISLTATPSAVIGDPVTATAVVSGGITPTGPVTFDLYGPQDPTCAQAPIDSSTINLDLNVVIAQPVTPTAMGTYPWRASYGGDALNGPASTPCGATAVVVTAPPLVITPPTSQSSVDSGTSVSAATTLTGGALSGGGTLSFALYGPNDPSCQRDPVFLDAQAANVVGGYVSGLTTPVAPGTYQWMVTFSGDAQDPPLSTACGAELLTVTAR